MLQPLRWKKGEFEAARLHVPHAAFGMYSLIRYYRDCRKFEPLNWYTFSGEHYCADVVCRMSVVYVSGCKTSTGAKKLVTLCPFPSRTHGPWPHCIPQPINPLRDECSWSRAPCMAWLPFFLFFWPCCQTGLTRCQTWAGAAPRTSFTPHFWRIRTADHAVSWYKTVTSPLLAYALSFLG